MPPSSAADSWAFHRSGLGLVLLLCTENCLTSVACQTLAPMIPRTFSMLIVLPKVLLIL